MGNNIESGFRRVPPLYLRDLRKKTDKRYRSLVMSVRPRTESVVEKENTQGNTARELTTKSVSEYIISNPDFLDDFVSGHISQDRVRAWLKGPSDESFENVESFGDGKPPGFRERNPVKEKARNTEEVPGQSEAFPERTDETRLSPDAEDNEEDTKSDTDGSLSSRELDTSNPESNETKSKDKIRIPTENSLEKCRDEVKAAPTAESDQTAKAEMDLATTNDAKATMDLKKDQSKHDGSKVIKKSKGNSFSKHITERGFRQRRLMLITRSRFLYPFKYRHEELSELIERPLASQFSEVNSHLFPYTEIQSDDISKVFIQMCMKLLGKHAFPMAELCYFLTTLKANYNKVEYHNYSHALSHAQSMYWMLKKNPGVFTELEMKSLLIASLAHDVGHPGLDESYMKKVYSHMAMVYDSPLLENHHVQVCFMILQDIKCNVFCDLDGDDYKQVLDDIKHAILSTTFDRYKLQCEKLRQVADAGIDLDKGYVRKSVKSLMMMACDLCGTWKRWEEHKNIVWKLYLEFYNQSDKEMVFGIRSPPQRMRSNSDSIPVSQVGFMKTIALPIFRLLSDIFPTLRVINKSAKDNLECWKTYK